MIRASLAKSENERVSKWGRLHKDLRLIKYGLYDNMIGKYIKYWNKERYYLEVYRKNKWKYFVLFFWKIVWKYIRKQMWCDGVNIIQNFAFLYFARNSGVFRYLISKIGFKVRRR